MLGHSILGMLAIESARRCPATVFHVIAVGTPPFGDMARVEAAAKDYFERHATAERKQRLRDNLAALTASATMSQQLAAQVPTRRFDPSFDAARLFEGAVLKPRLLGVLGPSWNISQDPGTFEVPLLLAHGRHDYGVPHTLRDGVIERLPTATLRTFESSGQQPFLEEPERFVAMVKGWLAEPRGV